jgi:putative hemolysin
VLSPIFRTEGGRYGVPCSYFYGRIKTKYLHGIRTGLTVLLQFPPDTACVIAPIEQEQLPKLAASSTPLAQKTFSLQAPFLASFRPRIQAEIGRYRVRLAETDEDREAACRLRFKVFNIEMGKGLADSYNTGLDADQFDLYCEHLLVEDKLESDPSRRVVGTYRMQCGITAARCRGYYSEQEFSFAPYEPLRADILELGRASIDRGYRSSEVLILLWRGIAQYASEMGLRYLVGCSSMNSKDPAEGWQAYRQLTPYLVPPEFRTGPAAAYACPGGQGGEEAQPSPRTEEAVMPAQLVAEVKIPKLLKTYMTIGARICGPPAWDRDFGTIDFLTLLDLKLLSPAARNRFLAPLTR